MTVAARTGWKAKVHAWRELASILFLPVSAIWLAGWYCLLTDTQRIQDQARVLIILLAAIVIAYICLRMLDAWRIAAGWRFLVNLTLFVLLIWFGENLLIYHKPILDLPCVLADLWGSFTGLRSLSVEFWSVILMSLTWIWILLYIRRPITQDRILSRMAFGLLALLVLLVISDRDDLSVIAAALGFYLVFSLCALSLARIADFNLIRESKRVRFDPRLLAGLAGLSILIVGAAVGTGLAASRLMITVILAIANGIMIIVRFLVERVVMPVVNVLIILLHQLLSLIFKPGTEYEIPKLNLEQPTTGVLDPMEIERSSAEALRAAQPYILTVIIILTVLTVALLFLLRRNREDLHDLDAEPGENVEGGFWKKLAGRIMQRAQEVLGRSYARINPRRAVGIVRAARIRWMYHQLEQLAERRGHPRPAATTPTEYENQLVLVWPMCKMDLQILTGAYLSVRYGELPESDQEVDTVKEAWGRIRKTALGRQVMPRPRRR